MFCKEEDEENLKINSNVGSKLGMFDVASIDMLIYF